MPAPAAVPAAVAAVHARTRVAPLTTVPPLLALTTRPVWLPLSFLATETVKFAANFASFCSASAYASTLVKSVAT